MSCSDFLFVSCASLSLDYSSLHSHSFLDNGWHTLDHHDVYNYRISHVWLYLFVNSISLLYISMVFYSVPVSIFCVWICIFIYINAPVTTQFHALLPFHPLSSGSLSFSPARTPRRRHPCNHHPVVTPVRKWKGDPCVSTRVCVTQDCHVTSVMTVFSSPSFFHSR